MTEYVYRPVRKRGKKEVRSPSYRGRFTVLGDKELHDVRLNTIDKQVAEQILRRLVSDREREAAGILAPRVLRQAAKRPLAGHIEEYLTDLDVRGRDSEYVRHVDSRLKTLASACRWRRLADITADSFEAWRSQKAASPRTLNQYWEAANGFMRWLLDHERVLGNPLSKVRRVESRGRETFHRRALRVDECRRLLDTAGPRRLVYLLALTSGLRRGEIKDLRWGDADLDGNLPCLRVRASTSKNHQAATIALRPELASALAAIRRANTEPGDLVFPKGVPDYTTVQADFKRAGIVLNDGAGGKVDFHALRTTFCTFLMLSGISARVAMALMRHSDMRLTVQVYTDAQALPTREALMQLPSLVNDASLPASHSAPLSPVRPSHGVSRVEELIGDNGSQNRLKKSELGTPGHGVSRPAASE